MRVGVLGLGAVGARATRQLAATGSVDEVLVDDPDPSRVAAVVGAIDPRVRHGLHGDAEAPDVVVLAGPAPHLRLAEGWLRAGSHVVSVSDDRDDVTDLLELDGLARSEGRALVVGAGFAPGLSCLLVAHARRFLDTVDELHVAKHGTGGPECAKQHHRALAGIAVDWHDGEWQQRPAGAGRELCWFPDPVGGLDCYRAELPDSLLLHRAVPEASRIIGRMSATRRDRFTARLPMLLPPHPEGLAGAVRVELRGSVAGRREIRVLGALDRPAAVAGAVGAVVAVALGGDVAGLGMMRTVGAGGVGELVSDATAMLLELARRGVRAAVFDGSATSSSPS